MMPQDIMTPNVIEVPQLIFGCNVLKSLRCNKLSRYGLSCIEGVNSLVNDIEARCQR